MTSIPVTKWADLVRGGGRLDDDEIMSLAVDAPATEELANAARLVRDAGHGEIVSVSRKVFIPLTELCRDVCHYCTFAKAPRNCRSAYMRPEEVMEIARRGVEAGCDEALFTLGDKPELRYAIARAELAAFGHETTIGYLREMAGRVLDETGLLPHINAGVMSEAEILSLREVSASQGIMLESASTRLTERGCRISAPPTSSRR